MLAMDACPFSIDSFSRTRVILPNNSLQPTRSSVLGWLTRALMQLKRDVGKHLKLLSIGILHISLNMLGFYYDYGKCQI